MAARSGTNVHEVADGIYRINTAITIPNGPGAFCFNQYLIRDDEPLLFHTGPRRLFPMVCEAITLGTHVLRWFDTPHLPHAWECGLLLDETTSTLLCDDLFTQPGSGDPPLTQSDALEA